MDWLEPVVKWVSILGAVGLAIFLQARHRTKDGRIKEKLAQAEEGNEAQERQAKAQSAARARDLLDDLKRVRDKDRG